MKAKEFIRIEYDNDEPTEFEYKVTQNKKCKHGKDVELGEVRIIDHGNGKIIKFYSDREDIHLDYCEWQELALAIDLSEKKNYSVKEDVFLVKETKEKLWVNKM